MSASSVRPYAPCTCIAASTVAPHTSAVMLNAWAARSRQSAPVSASVAAARTNQRAAAAHFVVSSGLVALGDQGGSDSGGVAGDDEQVAALRHPGDEASDAVEGVAGTQWRPGPVQDVRRGFPDGDRDGRAGGGFGDPV